MPRLTFQDYSQFTVEEFVSDPYFQDWVLDPDEEMNSFWRKFITTYSQKKEHILEARQIISHIKYKPYQLHPQRKEEILHQAYGSSQPDKPAPKVIRLLRQSFSPALAAAVVSALLVAGTLVWQLLPSYQTYRTAYGETNSFTLSDGSEITLNTNSSLKVRLSEESNRPREVWIEGEAFFQVKPLAEEVAATFPEQKKFIVHANGFTIEVLGTSFNVLSREQKSEILLASGTVKVQSQTTDESQILQPGDLLSLSENESFVLQKKEDISLPWREGFFVFEKTPLEEVAQQVEDFYGLHVTFAHEELAQKQFTAKIPRDQPEVLIQAIEESFNVTVIRKEETIEIVSKQ